MQLLSDCLTLSSVLASRWSNGCAFRQQRRRFLAVEPIAARCFQKVMQRLALLSTGRDHGPDASAPLSSCFAPGALRDVPINDHEADGLFRQIVRRLDP